MKHIKKEDWREHNEIILNECDESSGMAFRLLNSSRSDTAAMIYGFVIDVLQVFLHLVVQVIDDFLIVDESSLIVVEVVFQT